MFFWIVDFIFPVTMIILGYYYYFKKSQQAISKYSGLRTKATMTSKESWEFAHKFAGKILIYAGCGLCIYAIIIKLIEPLSAEWLSLINNAIYLIVFIAITVVIDRKTKLEGLQA